MSLGEELEAGGRALSPGTRGDGVWGCLRNTRDLWIRTEALPPLLLRGEDPSTCPDPGTILL